MRVLVTVPSLGREFGGPTVVADRLAGSLRRRGCEVLVVGVGGSETPGTVGVGALANFHGTPVPRSLGVLRRAVAQADLVHVLGYRDPVGTAAAWYAHRAGVPYTLEPVGMHRRRLRSLRLKAAFDLTVGRLVVSGAARIVATSQVEAGELTTDGIDPQHIVVRPNGVALERLLPLPDRGVIRRRFGIPEAAALVLSLGRITAKKGLRDILRAVAGLDGVWVLVAGPDDGDGTLPAIQKLRSELSYARRVIIEPGGLWGEDKAQALADADVFALPSVTENFGIAAEEAACCGLPVVVSEACGVKEWLSPHASRVVPTGDLVALRTAFRELLEDPSCRRRAADEASGIRQQLAWDRIANKQIGIYEDVIAGVHQGAPS